MQKNTSIFVWTYQTGHLFDPLTLWRQTGFWFVKSKILYFKDCFYILEENTSWHLIVFLGVHSAFTIPDQRWLAPEILLPKTNYETPAAIIYYYFFHYFIIFIYLIIYIFLPKLAPSPFLKYISTILPQLKMEPNSKISSWEENISSSFLHAFRLSNTFISNTKVSFIYSFIYLFVCLLIN